MMTTDSNDEIVTVRKHAIQGMGGTVWQYRANFLQVRSGKWQKRSHCLVQGLCEVWCPSLSLSVSHSTPGQLHFSVNCLVTSSPQLQACSAFSIPSLYDCLTVLESLPKMLVLLLLLTASIFHTLGLPGALGPIVYGSVCLGTDKST